MSHLTKLPSGEQEHLLGPDPLADVLRGAIREVIQEALEEEVTEALGADVYVRVQTRRGHRNGSKTRTVTTPLGAKEIRVPRARVFETEGTSSEFQSRMLPRYERRTREVDEALLGVYLQGVNTRRVKAALRPLLKGAALSKSTVSRVVARVKELLEAWQRRPLQEETIVYAYLDALAVKVRIAKKITSVPVLVAVSVREDGTKALLGLWLRGSESEEAWKSILEDLTARGLRAPVLVIIDGCPGLRAAVRKVWPGADVQRCTVHKLRNLMAHAPKHAHEEVTEDYHKIVYAPNEKAAEKAYEAFVEKWSRLARGVARSLEEAGKELLTFLRYPKSQWKSLRTTNIIERLNEEFRRRVKTQASLPDEDAVLGIFYGLFAIGAIRMRKVEGYRQVNVVHLKRKEELRATGS